MGYAKANDGKAETAQEEHALKVARQMVAAWNDLNADAIAELFAENGSLHSMMSEPIVGREILRERFTVLLKDVERLELQLRTIAVLDDTVILERVDEVKINGEVGRIPVVGVLVINGDHVQEWREYYDRNQLLAAMGMLHDDLPGNDQKTAKADTHIQTVKTLIEAWKVKDIDTVAGFMADDIVWHYRVGSKPLKGKDKAQKFLVKFGDEISEIRWRINNYVENGNMVMVEGADDFVDASGKRHQTPYMGVFEFTDGKISAWRDYFDPALVEKGAGADGHDDWIVELLGEEQ